MNKKLFIILIGLAVAIVAWWAFRPELLFVNKQVNETFPTVTAAMMNDAQALVSGNFTGYAHESKGTATVYQLANGLRTLRFTDFSTSNGPDVHVYLIAAANAMDDATVKNSEIVDLGSIKGNVGDQNYDLPIDIDLSKYRAVTIWCKRFGVNFATAPLMGGDMMSSTTEPQPLASGKFRGYAHDARGTATVYQLADGSRTLRFTDFETSNGPDVRVYLVAAVDAKDDATVKNSEVIDLGSIKGNIGDQNYTVPANVDLNTFRAVTIWCKRFGVNFATAPLSMPSALGMADGR